MKLFYVFLFVVTLSFPAMADVDIVIDKTRQQMTVSVDDDPLYQWRISTGRRGYDTPSGKFKANRMEEDHYSVEFQEAHMPHSIFFTLKGHAIHGTDEIKTLGQAVSHGCVRLHPDNAAILYKIVEQEGLEHTNVTVLGVEEPRFNNPQFRQFNPFWFLIPPQQQYKNERKYNAQHRGPYR